MSGQSFEALIIRFAELVRGSKRVVVFTGAGVSTESGIPDFRSPGGIWSRYDPDMFTIDRFLHDIEARKVHWKALIGDDFIPGHARPNAAHYAVAELERMGKLDCVITQNVDGLHEEAGSSPERVFHLHGTMREAKCIRCGKLYPMAEVREWVLGGTEVPVCLECGGILKPNAVFFGEALPEREITESERRSRSCDLCIVIGSSLVVYPAALMPQYAVQSGAKLVIINRDRTGLDSYAEVRIFESAGVTMSKLIGLLKESGR